MTSEEVKKTKKRVHRKLWEDIHACDWGAWERRFWDLKERAIPYDETTYTLLLHGYLLSHRHQSENAYLVLQEMEKAETHPALLRLNERLLNSAFELQELGCRPEKSLWRNLTRLCFHCSERFKKKRQKRLRKELEALEPDDALALGPEDAKLWLRDHDRLALPEGGARRFRFLEGAGIAQAALPHGSGSGALRLAGSGSKTGRRSGRRRTQDKNLLAP